MTATLAVVWFAGWHAERLAYQRKIEIPQNGAVEKQGVSPPSLGVAREFDTINGQIGVPLDLNRLAKRGNAGGMRHRLMPAKFRAWPGRNIPGQIGFIAAQNAAKRANNLKSIHPFPLIAQCRGSSP